ncbi:imelysin family protein [Nisaea nitritireducens]|uniref:imelysin family protein n=1 Tax=Nisaea nitritireducens TaxID=568392 RepID=UPI001868E4D4|nr:imelysin family protein [Nisaea nitritireducens]
MQRILILMVSFLAISAAGPAGPARAADADETFKAITKASVFDHIIPRYELLATAGVGLEAAATTYCQDRTAQSFTGLDSAFRDYWMAWAGIRHIQFGPVQSQNRGFRIQFWPDFRNKIGKQLSRVLAAENSTALEKTTFAKTSIAVQGLPALERLLLDGHAGFAGSKGAFKCALTETITLNLATIANNIAADWNPNDGYAHTVATAGVGESPYSEAYEVPVELLQSLLGELEASRDVRLGRPLGSQANKARPKLAEAWRSGLSKAILVESLKGTGDLYRSGGFEQALRNAGEVALADRISAGFQKAVTQADALEGSLYDAFTAPEGRKKLEAVRADLKVLTGLLGTDLAVALDISPGFNSRDGD